MIHFLVHDKADTVGVAVVDIAAGTQLTGRDLSTNKPLKAKSAQKSSTLAPGTCLSISSTIGRPLASVRAVITSSVVSSGG